MYIILKAFDQIVKTSLGFVAFPATEAMQFYDHYSPTKWLNINQWISINENYFHK